jgi:hypothetical protein
MKARNPRGLRAALARDTQAFRSAPEMRSSQRASMKDALARGTNAFVSSIRAESNEPSSLGLVARVNLILIKAFKVITQIILLGFSSVLVVCAGFAALFGIFYLVFNVILDQHNQQGYF